MDRVASRREDDELSAMMDVRAEWRVMGRGQIVLGTGHTLRGAADMALQMERWGKKITCVVRGPAQDIIVFGEQYRRLLNQPTTSERNRKQGRNGASALAFTGKPQTY